MVGNAIQRQQVARSIQVVLRKRPSTFWVEHTTVTVRNGGQQGDSQTFGPYRGVLAAPGSTRMPLQGVTQIDVTAGAMTVQPRWSLLTTPNVRVESGSDSQDYVTVNGIGRFKVSAVRPVADIVPPVGLVIGLDEQT